MDTKQGMVLLVALLLQYNQGGMAGRRANEAGQCSNTASTSGRGHWSGLGEYGGTMELTDGAVIHLPSKEDDQDYWYMPRGEVDQYAEMFANVWEDNIRKMDGKGTERMSVKPYDIMLDDFKVEGKSIAELVKEPTGVYVKVAEKDWRFCARMKIRKGKSAQSKCSICLVILNAMKMEYHALFDLTLNQSRGATADCEDNLELVYVKGKPQVEQAKLDLIEDKVMDTMIQRWAKQTITPIRAIDAALRKRAAERSADAAGEDVVKVRISSWVDMSK